MVQPMRSNASYRRVVWGLGQHYPGGRCEYVLHFSDDKYMRALCF